MEMRSSCPDDSRVDPVRVACAGQRSRELRRGASNGGGLVIGQFAEAGDVPPRHNEQVAEVRARVADLFERRGMEPRRQFVLEEQASRKDHIALELSADKTAFVHLSGEANPEGMPKVGIEPTRASRPTGF